MKNKSFWILLAAGILCILLAGAVYFFGGMTEELTDAISYRQNNNGGKITNETQISQSFFCKYIDITHLMMRTSTFGNTFASGAAVFSLADEKGNEIARQEIPLTEIKDKSAVTFTFDPIKGTGGKVLTLTASAQEMEEDKAYSLMIGQGSVGGVLTTAEGKTTENNSLFMTISYLNPVKAEKFTYFLMVIGVMLLSLMPMTGRKGRR